MLRTLFSATILAGTLAGSAMAQAPDAGCVLPSEGEPRSQGSVLKEIAQ
jgi:hypothetical protein